MRTKLLGLILLAAPVAGAGTIDSLIRLDLDPESSKQILAAHVFAQTAGAIGSQVVASDSKTLAAKGKKPVRLAFAVDWDQDGDDELVMVRERKKKGKPNKVEFRVYRVPIEIHGDIGKTLAKAIQSDIVFAAPDGFVTAAAIDRAGDGVDELALLFEEKGTQRLELRPLPGSGKGPLEAPTAVFDLGAIESAGRVVLLGAVNADAEGGEELVLLREDPSGARLLEIHVLPSESAVPVVTPTVSYVLPAGLEASQVGAFQIDGEADPRILLLARTESSEPSVRLYPLPDATGLALPAPLEESSTFVGLETFAAFAAGRTTEEPDEPDSPDEPDEPGPTEGPSQADDLIGTYQVELSVAAFVPPTDNLKFVPRQVTGTARIDVMMGLYRLTFPGGEVMPLTVTGEGESLAIQGAPMTIGLIVPDLGLGTAPVSVSLTGSFFFLNSSPGTLVAPAPFYTIPAPQPGWMWAIGSPQLSK